MKLRLAMITGVMGLSPSYVLAGWMPFQEKMEAKSSLPAETGSLVNAPLSTSIAVPTHMPVKAQAEPAVISPDPLILIFLVLGLLIYLLCDNSPKLPSIHPTKLQ